VCQFAKVIICAFGLEYIRDPNKDYTKILMAINENRGWSGMLGSIDCMHWTWKNCSKACHLHYCGRSNDPTIIEVVVFEYLWIWQRFFGLSGSLNDINVLQQSHRLVRLVDGDALTCNYTVNGNEYPKGYYLATTSIRRGHHL
jgi:hypothetical protein